MMVDRSVVRSLLVRWNRLFARGRFFRFGVGVYVFEGVEIGNPGRIEIGDGVVIQRHCYLAVAAALGARDEACLSIGNGSNIGPRNHIFAHTRIEIGEKVLTAPDVFISDCTHDFSDPHTAILEQPVCPLGTTVIGSHSWIGHGSVVIGCRVGRHCVIGANSVVLSNIPDYSVAVGAPARVVKRIDPKTGEWIATLAEKRLDGRSAN